MIQRLTKIAVVVRDYDEAIAFYTGTLGFALSEDTDLGDGKRWVTVVPQGSGCALVLARAATDQQRSRIGDQTGGRVFLFFETDDIERELARLRAAGVSIVRPPVRQPYGTVAVIEDLYGNKIDIIEPSEPGAERDDHTR